MLKTLCHARTTSHRAHESDLRNCLCGCKDAPDPPVHYIQREHFYHLYFPAIASIVGAEAPATLVDRLCLQNPRRHSIFMVAIAFEYDHSLENSCLEHGMVMRATIRAYAHFFTPSHRANNAQPNHSP
jgi:hypothetical protein